VKPTLANAGNTLVPAYLALLQRGFKVYREPSLKTESGPLWVAEDSSCRFVAEDLVTLLGLVGLYETRGSHWEASDQEIDSFLAEHGIP
jgi:hypothetical protein